MQVQGLKKSAYICELDSEGKAEGALKIEHLHMNQVRAESR